MSVKVLFQYIDEEPSLAIVRKRFGKGSSFIIKMEVLYKYLDDDYLVHQAMTCARHLGLGESKSEIYKIADLIMQSIDTLINMPPEVLQDKKRRQQAVITVNDQTFEAEIECP